jgi:major membrane immunogen (membrane-anchored lipoprotein)
MSNILQFICLMKTFIRLSFVLLVLLSILNGCKKDNQTSIYTDPSVLPVYGCMDPTSTNYNPLATKDDGSCKYSGNITFWYNSNGTNAKVTVGGQIGYITGYYSSGVPSCGSNYCANFTLPTGTYNFVAQSSWHTWKGTITVPKNDCQTMLLY